MIGKYQPVDLVRHFASQLVGADQKAYQALLEAFEAYAREITVAVTDAPAEHILNMQGRAKQTLIILELLRAPKPISPQNPQP
jgi:predicted Zn-dependent protease with MMP-like domain